MKIALLNITSGGMSGGYRKYLHCIIPRLINHNSVERLLVAIPRTVNLPIQNTISNKIIWLSLGSGISTYNPIDNKSKSQISKFDPEVIFIPTGRYWSLNGGNNVPVVTMPRNMAPFVSHNGDAPLFFKIASQVRKRNALKAVGKADRVIAISDFVKEQIVRSGHVNSDKIDVIPFGTEKICQNKDIKQPNILRRYDNSKIFFTGGSIYPYRGLEDIILATKQISDKQAVVVISGEIGQGMKGYYNKLLELIDKFGLKRKVMFIGSLNAPEMAWCYENCTAFVMTSRVEACPNMALEAMAHGCVSIIAENPPLPELYQSTGIYYAPGRADALADKINMVCASSKDELDELRLLVMKRARVFNWDNCCDCTVKVLRHVVEEFTLRK